MFGFSLLPFDSGDNIHFLTTSDVSRSTWMSVLLGTNVSVSHDVLNYDDDFESSRLSSKWSTLLSLDHSTSLELKDPMFLVSLNSFFSFSKLSVRMSNPSNTPHT